MQCSPSVTLTWHISLRLVVPGSEVAAGSRGEWGEGSCWGRLETGVRVRGARCTLQCPLQVRQERQGREPSREKPAPVQESWGRWSR